MLLLIFARFFNYVEDVQIENGIEAYLFKTDFFKIAAVFHELF